LDPNNKADGPMVVSFLKSEIEKSHGFPKSIYTDNATYFSQGQFQEHLNNHRIKHYPAPKTHPQSVGLSERYVRLVLEGLRKKLKQLSKNDCQITAWSYYLPGITHAINTRVVKTHGFTPSELLLGRNPILNEKDKPITDNLAVAGIILSKFVEDNVGNDGASEDQMSWITR
jgi:hypothetical protein